MSEPRTQATHVAELVPGLFHWTIHDERIDFRSEAYAVPGESGRILIDPLPLTEDALRGLLPVEAIVITAGCHQRAAWSLRARLGVPVLAPAGARGLEQPTDREFDDEDPLGGALTALHRPGPTNPHFVLLWRLAGRPAALFCADLLMRGANGAFVFIPDDHQQDRERVRDSVRRLADADFELLCPAHGAPALEAGREVLREALRLDAAG